MTGVNLLAGVPSHRTPFHVRVLRPVLALLVAASPTLLLLGYGVHLQQQHQRLFRQVFALETHAALREPWRRRAAALNAERLELLGRLHATLELEQATAGPTETLVVVSHALPDDLWLTELDLDQGAGGLAIGGRTKRVAAVAELADGLRASGAFHRVDVESLATEGLERAPIVRFRIQTGDR